MPKRITSPVTAGLVGYARVSTADQNLALQTQALTNAGCLKIFSDKASGKNADRPGLEGALHFLREGDTLVVWKLDRLGRSLHHLIEIVNELRERGVKFRSLTEDWFDTTTAAGRMFLTIVGTFAEYERELNRERTMTGLASARARGRKGGRKPKLSPAQIQMAKKLLSAPAPQKMRDVCAHFKCSPRTLRRALAIPPAPITQNAETANR